MKKNPSNLLSDALTKSPFVFESLFGKDAHHDPATLDHDLATFDGGVDMSGPVPKGFDFSVASLREKLLSASPFDPFPIEPLPDDISADIDALPSIDKPYWPQVKEIEDRVELFYRIPQHLMACLFASPDGRRDIWIMAREEDEEASE